MTLAREHSFPPADGSGRKWCLHCGALWHAQMDATCVARAVALAPEPARRTYASEDFDAISARIIELKRERETA